MRSAGPLRTSGRIQPVNAHNSASSGRAAAILASSSKKKTRACRYRRLAHNTQPSSHKLAIIHPERREPGEVGLLIGLFVRTPDVSVADNRPRRGSLPRAALCEVFGRGVGACPGSTSGTFI